MPAPTNPKRLTRSTTDKILAGVCGGLGAYFELDATIFRIIFVLATLFGGFGLILYIILALLIPADTAVDKTVNLRRGVEEIGGVVQKGAERLKQEVGRSTAAGRNWLGVILVALGVLFLLGNFGFFEIFNFGRLWPLILVVIGFLVLVRDND